MLDRLKNPERRVPHLHLPTPTGELRPLRPGARHSAVLLILHPSCGACAGYAREVASRAGELEEWEATPLAVVSEVGTLDSGPTLPLVIDAEGEVARRLGVSVPAVIVADQWGEIHLALSAGDEHAFPGAPELVGWARFLAIRCPECEGEAL